MKIDSIEILIGLVTIFGVAFTFTGFDDKTQQKSPLKLISFKSDRNILIQNNYRKYKFCVNCVNSANEALESLTNYIEQTGIINSCSEICNYVETKTGSKTLGKLCNELCDTVGIEEFIRITQKADLDPIYYCELLRLCEIKDDGDVTIRNLTVTPWIAPQGQFFIAYLHYTSENGSGTGQIIVSIKTVDGIIQKTIFNNMPLPPGYFYSNLGIDTKPDPNCNSTKECEKWLPGIYFINILICNGKCGSKHPHSKIYDTATANFTITNSTYFNK